MWLAGSRLVRRERQRLSCCSRDEYNESVDLIGFSFEVKAYEKFYHRHIVDIPRIKFFV